MVAHGLPLTGVLAALVLTADLFKMTVLSPVRGELLLQHLLRAASIGARDFGVFAMARHVLGHLLL